MVCFDDSSKPLRHAPIEYMCMNNFTKSLEPLNTKYLENLSMDSYNGSLQWIVG